VIAAKPLTKGIIYPVVKRIALVMSGKMNKRIFASGVFKIISIIGAATSGGLTFFTFRPMAGRLKKHYSGYNDFQTIGTSFSQLE
jgi:hypothetical protein